MGVDAEKLFREALDEPAPPPPPDAVGDEGDDHGHVCRPPSLIVFADGSVTTGSATGTLLVAGFALGIFAAVWLVISALWAALTLQAFIVIGWAALAFLWAVAGSWFFLLWRERRRGER